MPTGIRPRVNEAKEFLEIAKDFKDPKEIIREALSNSWDANATEVSLEFDLIRIPGTRRKKLMIKISDNGDGMSDSKREGIDTKGIDTSELEDFFNLGDSNKPYGSIGTKGHGTKIYYKSKGIEVDTWKSGEHIHAQTEMPPWESLNKGIIPTYGYEKDLELGKGTIIIIDSFEGKQKDFSTADEIIEYIIWYTVGGSFGHYFDNQRKMNIHLKPTGKTLVTISSGFSFPNESLNLDEGSDNYCKMFGPETVFCGLNDNNDKVEVEIIGAILGESRRDIVSHTYDMMGLWLCKDYIKVQRNNRIIEDVFKGQYFYRNLLMFANCQQFDLTANRNNVRLDQEEYDLAIKGIKDFLNTIKDDENTVDYFNVKKT